MESPKSYSESINLLKQKVEDLRLTCEKENVPKSIKDSVIALERLLPVEKTPQPKNILSAQLSLYPLRQTQLSPLIQQALQALRAK